MVNRWRTLGGRISIAVLVGTTGVACDEVRGPASNGAPPTVVCGTTLSRAAAGAVVYDIAKYDQVITGTTVGGMVFLRVSDDCRRGARVTWTPMAAATLVTSAIAKDGLAVAVVLRPETVTAAFIVSAERNGAVVAHASVRLDG